MTQEEIESLGRSILSYLLKSDTKHSWFSFFVLFLDEQGLLDDFQSFVDRTIK